MKKIFNHFWCTLATLCLVLGACKEDDLPEVNREPFFSPNGDIALMQVKLGAPGNSLEGGYLDLATGTVYQEAAVGAQEGKVDLLFAKSSSGAVNLMVPASAGLEGWDFRNRGTLMKLRSTSSEELAMFNSLKTSGALETAYTTTQQTLATRTGYVAEEDGPSDRVLNVVAGDLILYKSLEENRQIIAIGRAVTVSTGNSGALTIDFKVAQNIKGATPAVQPDPATDYKKLELMLGSQTNAYLGNNLDFFTGKALVDAEASAAPGSVDLLLANSSTFGFNLMTPGGPGVIAFGGSSETKVLGWGTRNNGELIKLTSPIAQELQLLTDIQTASQIETTYNALKATAASRPNYNATNDGASDRIRSIEPGDLILYKSLTPGRKIYAVGRAVNLARGNAGSMVLQMKVSAELVNVPPPPVSDITTYQVTWGGQSNTSLGYFLDLKTGNVYNNTTSPANADKIDLFNAFGATTGVNFYTPGVAQTAFGAIETLIKTWPTRNNGNMVKLRNTTPEEREAFDALEFNQEIEAAYDQAQASVTSRAGYVALEDGPTNTRLRKLVANDIVYFRSASRNFTAAILVQDAEQSSTGTITLVVKVKKD
ncbi:hypothetical protein [Rufibacter quisquiliarum]|uniref:Uncharacterized protein n=1 Tax=Rufibacter quisquiliarum TaxID=1549639 RepID=A0A839GI18_9BACT|nr:hypothetical protein [Rufibacter quisquiliarum]MBA9079294.1 hypothetical protein [Rufibacter quisquiliarum]